MASRFKSPRSALGLVMLLSSSVFIHISHLALAAAPPPKKPTPQARPAVKPAPQPPSSVSPPAPSPAYIQAAQQSVNYFNDAITAYKATDLNKAEQLALQAVKVVPADFQYRFDMLNFLARVQVELSHFQDAVPHVKQAIELARKSPPANHPHALYDLNSLYYHILAQKPENTAALLEQAAVLMPLTEKRYGAVSLELARMVDRQVDLYYAAKQYDKTVQSARQALSIYQKLPTPPADAIQRLEHNLKIYEQHAAIAAAPEGKLVETVKQSPGVTVVSETKVDPATGRLVTSQATHYQGSELYDLGTRAFIAGDKFTAMKYYKDALAVSVQALGPDHEQSKRLRERIFEVATMSTADNYVKELSVEVTRWNDKTKTVYIYIEPCKYDGFCQKPETAKLIKKAYQTWAEALQGRLAFEYVESPKKADIQVKWQPKADKKHPNRHGFNTLAVNETVTWDNYMAENNIIIFDEQMADATSDELYSTLLHEVGHSLGLDGHSSQPGDVLFSYNSDELPTTTQLSQRDISTIRMIYDLPAQKTNPPDYRLAEFKKFQRGVEARERTIYSNILIPSPGGLGF